MAEILLLRDCVQVIGECAKSCGDEGLKVAVIYIRISNSNTPASKLLPRLLWLVLDPANRYLAVRWVEELRLQQQMR